jgi:hypothetical protein
MKRYTRNLIVSAFALAVLYLGGCKHEPNPPTEQDALAVAKNIQGKDVEVLSLKKTNGQMQTINGTKVYTLYYTGTKKVLTAVGRHPPGWVYTWSSNYPFQWTEKGWLGPDNQVYLDH